MFIPLYKLAMWRGTQLLFFYFYFFVGLASFLSTHNNLKKKWTPTSLIVLANAAGLLTAGVYCVIFLNIYVITNDSW